MEEQPARDTEGSGDHWSRLRFRLDREAQWIGPVEPEGIPFAGGTLRVELVVRAPERFLGVIIAVDTQPLARSSEQCRFVQRLMELTRSCRGWEARIVNSLAPCRLRLSAEVLAPVGSGRWPECELVLHQAGGGSETDRQRATGPEEQAPQSP